jgi:hypothetical protein
MQYSFKGKILDASTKESLPARVVITNDTGHTYNSYYKKLPGFFTEEDGTFSIQLNKGKYAVQVFRGIDYHSTKFDIHLSHALDTTILLNQWYPLKKQGWYNGDGHDHLYTDKTPDTAMLRLVRKICIAQGVDFMYTAQGWAGYNDTTWKTGYAKFSDYKFKVWYGSEMPKYRTGHTWWIGQQSTRGEFEATMDTVYENHYYQADTGTTWSFKILPFPNEPDVHVVERFKRADNSLAVAAHPTSWWMQKRGEIEKYVTNVACNLSFGLLSGKTWDGIVAMGYDHDHYFYQNLWFNILNQGYRMPAFSELDGGLGTDDKFYYGSMRTYFKINGELTSSKIVEAARKGRSFLTSGPIVMASVDNMYQIGDIIPADGKQRSLKIDAYASGEEGDFLSYIIVYRNGKIFRLWDMRGQNKQIFSASLPLSENRKSWYIVKVYGARAWQDTASLDLMAVCERTVPKEFMEGERDVAFTNPFYFRNTKDKEPGVLTSNVELILRDSVKKKNIKKGRIEVQVAGKTVKTLSIKSEVTYFSMPVNGVLKITIPGYEVFFRNLYLDYQPHRDLVEELASGRWRNRYDSSAYHPGEVPWEAFNYQKTRKVLKDVTFNVILGEAERNKRLVPRK